MKLTNQLMLLLGGCVTSSVLLLASIMVSGFHDLTHYHQQQELQAIVTILEQEFLHNPDAPRVQSWLPPILAANGVMRIQVSFEDVPILIYSDDAFHEETLPLTELQLGSQHDPGLRVRFSVRDSLSVPSRLKSMAYLALGGVLMVALLLWLAMGWIRRRLQGVEQLEQRARLQLQGKVPGWRYGVSQKWPQAVSQLLSQLQSELDDAKKERSRFDTYIRHNVYIDKLLGIGNRIFLDNRLEAVLHEAGTSHGAIVWLELEAYERVALREGEEVANQLLLECRYYLDPFVSKAPGGVLARYASNTLALLLPTLGKQEILTLCGQLLQSLDRWVLPDYVHQEQALYIGAVCYQPGEQRNQLEEEGQIALRSAKSQQERNFVLYDKPLRPMNSEKGSVRWRTLLERLFARKQIHYLLQEAKPSLLGRPMLQELLALLPDEQGELLQASYFLVMVEKCGMQLPFDRLMTRQALHLLPQAARQQIPLCLNLHPLTLLDREFRRWFFLQLLSLGRRRLAYLVLEFNETQLCRHEARLSVPLRELRLLGVKLSVDHVGQEVLNTHYIRAFELSYLKLHPSLVRNIQQNPLNQMAVRSLVGSCVHTQTRIIALGVEQEEEWLTLQSLGVNGGQGYLFGRPKSLVGDGSS